MRNLRRRAWGSRGRNSEIRYSRATIRTFLPATRLPTKSSIPKSRKMPLNMENEDVLVDSCVFIHLLNAGEDPAEILGKWAGDRTLLICGMVRLEVLRGISYPKTHRQISRFMDSMSDVETNNELWQSSADLAWKLDRSGKGIAAPDILIAASALSVAASILTFDRHFNRIDGLKIIAPPMNWCS